MKKTLITIVIILIIAGAGYFVFFDKNKICTTDAPMAKNIKTGEIRGFSNGCLPRGWERVQYEEVSMDVKSEESKKPIDIWAPITGDFNGDGKVEIATSVLTKKGIGSPMDGGTADEYEIQFSDKSIPPITNVSMGREVAIIDEGDLNNDKKDDISIYTHPLNGFHDVMRTYSLLSNKWIIVIPAFDILTEGDYLNYDELQKMVFKENGSIYYYDDNADGKRVKNVISTEVKKPEVPTLPKTNTTTTYMCGDKVKVVRVQDSPSLPPRVSYVRVSDNAGIASYGDFGAYIRPEYFSIDRAQIEEGYSFNETNFCKYLKN